MVRKRNDRGRFEKETSLVRRNYIPYCICITVLILVKEPVFPFDGLVPNQVTTEPGTFRTRSQPSTARLSRRRIDAIQQAIQLCKYRFILPMCMIQG